MTVRDAEPVLDYTARLRALPQFRSYFLGAFAGLALVFALAGIWAQVAFAVAERRREFGIRMALGAQGGAIVVQAMRHISRLTALGIAVGVFGAWVATRLLQTMLFNVKPADLATFAAVTVVFAAVALAAAYLPARRAAGIDPARALRAE
ncbi:MAG: FtsX-like permease family protein [Terriglobales bacterium]